MQKQLRPRDLARLVWVALAQLQALDGAHVRTTPDGVSVVLELREGAVCPCCGEMPCAVTDSNYTTIAGIRLELTCTEVQVVRFRPSEAVRLAVVEYHDHLLTQVQGRSDG